MRTNPISDALDFLTQGGGTSYVFWLLTIASIVIAAVNLARDSSQRSVLHLWNWLARFSGWAFIVPPPSGPGRTSSSLLSRSCSWFNDRDAVWAWMLSCCDMGRRLPTAVRGAA
jgi:hypothetical protein